MSSSSLETRALERLVPRCLVRRLQHPSRHAASLRSPSVRRSQRGAHRATCRRPRRPPRRLRFTRVLWRSSTSLASRASLSCYPSGMVLRVPSCCRPTSTATFARSSRRRLPLRPPPCSGWCHPDPHRTPQIVVAHGGDILKFAGDAFIASWRADSAASAPGQAAGGGATCGSSRGSRAGRGSCAQTFFDGDALAAALRPGSQASGDASEPEPSVLGCAVEAAWRCCARRRQ